MSAWLLACALSWCAPPAGAAPAPKPAAKEELVSEPSMEFALPKGWRRVPDEEGGVLLVGPAGKERVTPFISLQHYPPGSGDSAARYIDRYQKPAVQTDFIKASKPKETLVGKLPAKTFVEDALEFVPPSSMDTKEVPVRCEHVVLERGKGFYTLVFRAARADFDRLRPAFAAVLKSFKPK